VQASDTGLRGGQDHLQQQQVEDLAMAEHRNLQSTLFRTPVTRSAARVDNGGTSVQAWPFGGFDTPPAFNKLSLEVTGGDINVDRIRVQPRVDDVVTIFEDRSPADDYKVSVTGVELPPDTIYRSFLKRNVEGCFDSPPLDGEPGKVPLLQGFNLDYAPSNFDRNVHHVRVQVDTLSGTNRPIIRVCHADNNSDDAFNFVVNYALVDEAFVIGTDEFGKTKIGGGVDNSVVFNRPTNTVGVITGFDLEYLSGDRDMKEMLVEVNQDGRILVNLADATRDDSYRWKVFVSYIGAPLPSDSPPSVSPTFAPTRASDAPN
jgi:hypothetical protein